MKKLCSAIYIVTLFSIVGFIGCKKQTAVLNLPKLTAYYPLQVGRVLTYRLDSTVIDASNTQLIVKSYLLKDSFAGTFNDNVGRLSYLVYRYITDTLNTQPWQPLSTYYITPTEHSVEVVDDNNLRFIKLVDPIQNDITWSGNSYIDTKSANSLYQYMDGWPYTYQNVNMPFTVIKGVLDSTVTVLQVDETSPPGPFDPTQYQQRNYSLEVYANGIGLAYKDFLCWTWDLNPYVGYVAYSYGFKLNLISVQ